MFFPLFGGECLVVVEIFFSQSPHLTVADVINIKRPSYINRINDSRNNLPKECQQKWWWILVTFATLRHPRRGGQYLIEQNCLFYLCMLYGLLIQLSCSRENGPTYARQDWAEPVELKPLNGEHFRLYCFVSRFLVNKGNETPETWHRVRFCCWHFNSNTPSSSKFCISSLFSWVLNQWSEGVATKFLLILGCVSHTCWSDIVICHVFVS